VDVEGSGCSLAFAGALLSVLARDACNDFLRVLQSSELYPSCSLVLRLGRLKANETVKLVAVSKSPQMC
jgi:hypothetical protein